jgi:hypothetical protein
VHATVPTAMMLSSGKLLGNWTMCRAASFVAAKMRMWALAFRLMVIFRCAGRRPQPAPLGKGSVT